MAEALAVVVLIGALAAIAAPSWMKFKDRYALNAANNDVLLAMREAQSKAIRTKTTWQASFRETDGIVEWAVHPTNLDPGAAVWQSLDAVVRMDEETTLREAGGVRRVRFNHRGRTSGQLGRVTLSSKNGGDAKRCTIVSTLLGAMRQSKNKAKPEKGKYCY
ncbi:prepilin-type cleavage/methylation domain-containing protein [Oscillatoriales cyanobacterium LEGE 11467]|uniref:Prepilin-type cleavage/methylation domain-containing protein n=1 Tax=Zarconia navalis LEGE 11467 TaxID=1828826 RepID=A0A928ZA98_9CYAN|nr:GspH/FimT family pseudopilin [Zarconia navalis]MBE9041516.1 prepilin-type cleavage/methylation domain-containing protein [Zarconia navalis LEGE 11467]